MKKILWALGATMAVLGTTIAALNYNTTSDALDLITLGGTTVTLIDNGDLQGSGGYRSNKYHSMGENTAVRNADGSYIFDMSKIDSNTQVTLDGSFWQGDGAGRTYSVEQRAEILTIVQEICARPEITITPQQLLGFWYVESTAYIPGDKSIFETTWSDTGSKYEGPFQHGVDAWNGTGDYRGKAFICSLENPNLSDDQRVQTSDTCTLTVNGLKRPSLYYFPDAAYSAAYRLTKHYTEPSMTDDMAQWCRNNGGGATEEDVIRVVGMCGWYNGWTNTVKTYLPPFYMDLLKKHGAIDQWSNLGANGREAYNNKVKELFSTTPRTYPDWCSGPEYTYFPDYKTAIEAAMQNSKNSSWESAQYAFMIYNGGKYIYDGLTAMAKALGATKKSTSSYDASKVSAMQAEFIEWCDTYVGSAYFKDSNGNMLESTNWCGAFASAAWCGVGLPFVSGNAKDMPHDHPFKFNSDGTVDWSEIPVGASCVSVGEPVGGVLYGHVAVYVGNGYVVEAGGSTVQKKPIDQSYGAGYGWVGWGTPPGLDTVASGKIAAEFTGSDIDKINQAVQYVVDKDIRYHWGGKSPQEGMDCSGFIYWLFKETGLCNWPRTTADGQYNDYCDKITKDQLKPGDLIFYTNYNAPNSTYIGHVALYLGPHKTAQMSNEGEPISISDYVDGCSLQPAIAWGRVRR